MAIEQALQDAQAALRNVERDVSSASWFNTNRYEKNRGEMQAALARIEAAHAGHPEVAELRARFAAVVDKADEYSVDAIKQDIDGLVRGAQRDLDAFDRARSRGPRDADPHAHAEKYANWIKKICGALDGKRPSLA